VPAIDHYPGPPRMQALLAALAAYYAHDPRVRAVALFGSLARGDWDAYSDADLDVVLADGVEVDAVHEAAALGQALAAGGEHVALVVPGPLADSVDLVFTSLLEVSIRYHPLATTSPNITDSLVVLTGTLAAFEIAAAGQANRHDVAGVRQARVAACLRYALEADGALRRGELWGALDLLHRARSLLFDLYAVTHTGAPRVHHLRRDAPAAPIGAWLAATMPALDPSALRSAHAAMLDVVEEHLSDLTDGRVALTPEQRHVILALRTRGVDPGA
jgi:predicted nucleotidyltransferase